MVQRRPPVEPLIETLRAGHDDSIGRNVVQRDSLFPLCVVPHEHTVRNCAQDRFARQVIPAPHTKGRGIPERARGLQAIELRRHDNADQRGKQNDIGLLRAKKGVDGGAARNRPLIGLQHGACDRPSDSGMRAGRGEQPQTDARHALPRPRPEPGGTGVGGIEIPEVINRHPELGRKRCPLVFPPGHPAE